MKQQKIDMFVAMHGSKFEPFQMAQISSQLNAMTDDRVQLMTALPYKDPQTLLIISIVGGGLGIDRFMLDEVGLGVLKLLTAGGCGIWAIVDWFSAQSRAKQYNFNLFQKSSFL